MECRPAERTDPKKEGAKEGPARGRVRTSFPESCTTYMGLQCEIWANILGTFSFEYRLMILAVVCKPWRSVVLRMVDAGDDDDDDDDDGDGDGDGDPTIKEGRQDPSDPSLHGDDEAPLLCPARALLSPDGIPFRDHGEPFSLPSVRHAARSVISRRRFLMEAARCGGADFVWWACESVGWKPEPYSASRCAVAGSAIESEGRRSLPAPFPALVSGVFRGAVRSPDPMPTLRWVASLRGTTFSSSDIRYAGAFASRDVIDWVLELPEGCFRSGRRTCRAMLRHLHIDRATSNLRGLAAVASSGGRCDTDTGAGDVSTDTSPAKRWQHCFRTVNAAMLCEGAAYAGRMYLVASLLERYPIIARFIGVSAPIYARACTGLRPREMKELLASKGLPMSPGQFWDHVEKTATPEQIRGAVLCDDKISAFFIGRLSSACNVPALIEIARLCAEGGCAAARPALNDTCVCDGVLVSHARRWAERHPSTLDGPTGGGGVDANPFVRCARAGYPFDARRVVSEILSRKWRGKGVEGAMEPVLDFLLAIGELGLDPRRIPTSPHGEIARGCATSVGIPVDLRWLYEQAARFACPWVLGWLHRRVPPEERPPDMDVLTWVARGGMGATAVGVFDTESLAVSLKLRFGIRITSDKLADRGKWRERDPEDPLSACDWALACGYPLDGPLFCALAAARGKTDLLRWARAKGCGWDDATALGALYHFVRCSYVGSHCETAKELLDWVMAEGCPYLVDDMAACCAQSGFRWDDRTKSVMPAKWEASADLALDGGGGGRDGDRNGSGDRVGCGGRSTGDSGSRGIAARNSQLPSTPGGRLGHSRGGAVGMKRRAPTPIHDRVEIQGEGREDAVRPHPEALRTVPKARVRKRAKVDATAVAAERRERGS